MQNSQFGGALATGLNTRHPAIEAGGQGAAGLFAVVGIALAIFNGVFVGVAARRHHQAVFDEGVGIADQHRGQHADVAFVHFLQRREFDPLLRAVG